MKKLSFLIVLLLSFALINGCGKKDDTAGKDSKDKTESTDQKKSDSKDVEIGDDAAYHIKYSVTGDKEGILMDMWMKGKKVKSEINVAGEKMKSTVYYLNNMVYTLTDAQGMKMAFKMDMSEMKGDKNFDKTLLDAKEKLKDYEKLGTEEVIGYKCTIYKDKDGNKFWMYKDRVPMKFESKNSKMEAKEFEPNIKPADDFFDPPKDVDFKSMGDMKIGDIKKK